MKNETLGMYQVNVSAGTCFSPPSANDPKMMLNRDTNNQYFISEGDRGLHNGPGGVVVEPIESLTNPIVSYGNRTTNYGAARVPNVNYGKLVEKAISKDIDAYIREQEFARKEIYDKRKEERRRKQKYEDAYAAGRVIERNDGSLGYVIDIPEKELYGTTILNCEVYRAVLYTCSTPKRSKVLEVKVIMKDGKEIKFCVKSSQNGFCSKSFAKAIHNANVRLIISKRKASEVHNHLLEYTLDIAEQKQVFQSFGWWKTESGSWRFVEDLADILKEAEDND